MKVLQINTTINSGSTGRIVEDIGKSILLAKNESYVAYSRKSMPSKSTKLSIGSKIDFYYHILQTRLFDLHGFGSKISTRYFIQEIEIINPDVIHLHNIHGYYLNIEILFDYLKKKKTPLVWTFHDCWAFTGHCTYFDSVNCKKWKTGCYSCPKTQMYPKSWFIDNSENNYIVKKDLFQEFEKLTIVTPSHWLKNVVKESFLNDYEISVIHNGIDLEVFKPRNSFYSKKINELKSKNIVLGVASIWDDRKGLKDFIRISSKLEISFQIVLIGCSKSQIKLLPKNILGISRTENTEELAAWYSAAKVFVNPTYQDNFPTTNIEALACGTPVVTYDTGGSGESINDATGIIVKKGDINELLTAIKKIVSYDSSAFKILCRQRAEQNYDRNDRYQDYLELYDNLII